MPQPRAWVALACLVVLSPGLVLVALQLVPGPACRAVALPFARAAGPCGAARVGFAAAPQQIDDRLCDGCSHYLVTPAGPEPAPWRVALEFTGLRPECGYQVWFGDEFRVAAAGALEPAGLRRAGDDGDLRCTPARPGTLQCELVASARRTHTVLLTTAREGEAPALAADGMFVSVWPSHGLGVRADRAAVMTALGLAAAATCLAQVLLAAVAPLRAGWFGVGLAAVGLWARPEEFGGRADAPVSAAVGFVLVAVAIGAALPSLRRAYQGGRVVFTVAVAGLLGGLLGAMTRRLVLTPAILGAGDVSLQILCTVLAGACVALLVLDTGIGDRELRTWLRERLSGSRLACVAGALAASIGLFAFPSAWLLAAVKLGRCSLYVHGGLFHSLELWSTPVLLAPAIVGLGLVARSSWPTAGPRLDARLAAPFFLIDLEDPGRAIRGTIRVTARRGAGLVVRRNGVEAAGLQEDVAELLQRLARLYAGDAPTCALAVDFEYAGDGDFGGQSYQLPLALLYLRCLGFVPSAPITASGSFRRRSTELLGASSVAAKLTALRPGEWLVCPLGSGAGAGIELLHLADRAAVRRAAGEIRRLRRAGGPVVVEVGCLDHAVDLIERFVAARARQ
jgi:hypothetical protein